MTSNTTEITHRVLRATPSPKAYDNIAETKLLLQQTRKFEQN